MAAGQIEDAIEAWGRAARVGEIESQAANRVRDARLALVRRQLQAKQYAEAIKTLGSLPEDEQVVALIVEASHALIGSDPNSVREALERSPAAQAADRSLYRQALLGSAQKGCSPQSLRYYDGAHAIEPLSAAEASAASTCAGDLGSRAVEVQDYSGAVRYYNAGLSLEPSGDGVEVLRDDLRKAARNRGAVPGVLLGAGGVGLLATSGLFWMDARQTADQLRSQMHSTTEVDSLVQDGRSKQLGAAMMAAGGVVLAGSGAVLYVRGGRRVPDVLRGVNLSLAPTPDGAAATLAIRGF